MRYATVQAGSGIIGDAAGTSVIVEADAANQFGEGATIIVWPSGKNLDPSIHNYETMLIASKSGTTLTVTRGTEEDPTGLATFAEGDQLALSFPVAGRPARTQTQVITVGKTPGNGPTVDLGADSLGIVGLITARVANVNLDGGTPPFNIDIGYESAYDGDFGTARVVTTPSGVYSVPVGSLFSFVADDPAPIYGSAFIPRYVRFTWDWNAPADLGVNAVATITLQLEYF